jgi:hypothetical protein
MDETKQKQQTSSGAGRLEQSEELGTYYFVSRSVCERTNYVLLLFFTMDVEQLI